VAIVERTNNVPEAFFGSMWAKRTISPCRHSSVCDSKGFLALEVAFRGCFVPKFWQRGNLIYRRRESASFSAVRWEVLEREESSLSVFPYTERWILRLRCSHFIVSEASASSHWRRSKAFQFSGSGYTF
jgi:hypothetical protein